MKMAKATDNGLSVVCILETKLPTNIARSWAKVKKIKGATLQNLHQFLDEELMLSLEAKIDVLSTASQGRRKYPVNTIVGQTVKAQRCSMGCSENHILPNCSMFLDLSPKDRMAFCTNNRLCYRCLKPHRFGFCRARCELDGCGHALLHEAAPRPVFLML